MDAKSVLITAGWGFAAWKIAKLIGGLMISGEPEPESEPKRANKIWVIANMGLAAWSIRNLSIPNSEPKLTKQQIGALVGLVFATRTIAKKQKKSKIWTVSNVVLAGWSMSELLIEGSESEPEIRKDRISGLAGLVFARWAIARQLGGSDPKQKKGKKMKAPGRDGEYMYREEFEDDPRTYFLDLRGSRRNW